MDEFHLDDVVTFESKTYKLIGQIDKLPAIGSDKFICVGSYHQKLICKERETVCILLVVFNVWLIVQSLLLLRIFKGHSSAIQIGQGTITFLFSLVWV